jgi:dienelactone hydrolase
MQRRIFQRIFKTIAVLALIAAAGVAALVATLWFDHSRTTELPTPTGSFAVGRATSDWTDEARLNPYAPTPGLKQELPVWIWYPADRQPSAQTAEYLPPYWIRALGQHEGFLLRRMLSRDLTRVKTHSYPDVPVSTRQQMYPVVILRAGGGALSSDFTSIAEDIASHGYIVVSFDAPYRTVVTAFPDGRVAIRAPGTDFDTTPNAETRPRVVRIVNAWIADIQFVLGRLALLNANDPSGKFTARLDLQKLAIVGHSLGGATSAQFCHDDPRCKAGIDIDGMPFGNVIQQGLHQPFFFLLSDHTRERGPEAHAVEDNIESIYDKLPPNARWQMTIVGANHFTFSDQMLTKSPIFVSVLQAAGVFGRLDKRRGLIIASACVSTFLDVTLKGLPSGKMVELPARFPEVKPGIQDAFPRPQSPRF